MSSSSVLDRSFLEQIHIRCFGLWEIEEEGVFGGEVHTVGRGVMKRKGRREERGG